MPFFQFMALPCLTTPFGSECLNILHILLREGSIYPATGKLHTYILNAKIHTSTKLHYGVLGLHLDLFNPVLFFMK